MTESSSSPTSTAASQNDPIRQEATVIDEAQLLAILTDCENVVLTDDGGPATLVIDSYATTWIQHLLEERHGVVVDLIGETSDVASVPELLALITARAETPSP